MSRKERRNRLTMDRLLVIVKDPPSMKAESSCDIVVVRCEDEDSRS